jgi:galactokinase/mevalonate kinase-like predicted kinase
LKKYKLTIPARINILGNPGDANEGDFATISAAVNMRAGARVEPAEGMILESKIPQDRNALEVSGSGRGSTQCNQLLEFRVGQYPLPYTGEVDLQKGAINRLYQFSPEFREKYARQGFRLAFWSEVPRQSGLGGSSLFVLLTLAGLRCFYELDPRRHNDYILAELAQRVEARELGITCGFADRYVPLFGGLAYIDYRGKLHHKEICQEPFATYERLEDRAPNLPLVAVSTGIEHESGDVHAPMRARYLEENQQWESQGGQPPPMVRFMSAAWQTAWRGKIALLEGDVETFGELMNENHRLVDEMMTYCGFRDGAGWANNLLIEAARSHGALGAKLTGAGSGGSVFALVRAGQEEQLGEVWQQTAKEAGLTSARVFRLQISRQGLEIQELR